MIDLIVSALTSLFTIVNLRIYRKREDKAVPRWLPGMYRLLTCSYRWNKDIDNGMVKRNSKMETAETRNEENHSKFKKRSTVFELDMATRAAYSHSPVQRFDSRVSTQDEENIRWKDISKMLDYILLTFFSLVTVISFILFSYSNASSLTYSIQSVRESALKSFLFFCFKGASLPIHTI